jgi:hypothetical protein
LKLNKDPVNFANRMSSCARVAINAYGKASYVIESSIVKIEAMKSDVVLNKHISIFKIQFKIFFFFFSNILLGYFFFKFSSFFLICNFKEKPRIIKGPVRNITVIVGSTFTIECQAAGFPEPFINWRLNWGHVCEEPRCHSTNENGKGVFTVNEARLSDAGAYSCEAINSEGRVFAVPDAIVYVILGGK